MRWTVVLVLLQVCAGLQKHADVPIVAEPLSTVLHPNLHLSFDVAFVCGKQPLVPMESRYSYFMERATSFSSGITARPGNFTSGELPCANLSRYSEEEWKALASERYRLQFSVNGEPIFYTEHILSQIAKNMELRVTGCPAIKLNEMDAVFVPQRLSFKLYGTCDNQLCSLAHAEVNPTYTQLKQHTQKLKWDVEWVEVPNVFSEYVNSLLHNDDETHIQISAIAACFVLAILTALIVLLAIRRKLTPFLKEGSTCWAALPMLMNSSYQLREIEMNVESGEAETLLSTSERVPVNLDGATWR